MQITERLRRRIAALGFDAGNSVLTISCSFGVSQWLSGCSPERLLKLADVALYQAKQAGRNRVAAAETDAAMVPQAG